MGSTPTLATLLQLFTSGMFRSCCTLTACRKELRGTTTQFITCAARLHEKRLAPGEARTPDLRISLSILTYKYDALTDCATGANMEGYSFPPMHLVHLVLNTKM